MQKLDQQQRREEQELAAMQEDLGRMAAGSLTGHQSEPTTPPEYRETSSGFPTMFSRPNRYSTSSLTSPPGLYTRPARSGSQLASPQSGVVQARFALDDQLPSRSVPGSRRNSDEDDKEEAVRQDPTSHRSTNASVAPFSFLQRSLSLESLSLESPSPKSLSLKFPAPKSLSLKSVSQVSVCQVRLPSLSPKSLVSVCLKLWCRPMARAAGQSKAGWQSKAAFRPASGALVRHGGERKEGKSASAFISRPSIYCFLFSCSTFLFSCSAAATLPCRQTSKPGHRASKRVCSGLSLLLLSTSLLLRIYHPHRPPRRRIHCRLAVFTTALPVFIALV